MDLKRGRSYAGGCGCAQMGIEVARAGCPARTGYRPRDLKPATSCLTRTGMPCCRPCLAQAPGAAACVPAQQPEAASRTPAYMSPEQHDLRDYLSSASDIYALGLVLFEAVDRGGMYRNQRPGTRARQPEAGYPGLAGRPAGAHAAGNPKERPWNGEEAQRIYYKVAWWLDSQRASRGCS